MKKFTETVDPERISGHRDADVKDRLFSDPKIQKMVMEIAETCEENKNRIQELLSNLSKIETDSRKNDKKTI